MILDDYPRLVSDLRQLSGKNRPKIILVKANICRLLEKRLLDDGFDVINGGAVIYFPSNGNQDHFRRQIAPIMALVR
jgi:hypothetical protein